MKKNKKNYRKLGNQYEKIAGEYLVCHGYEILEYNFRCRMGEIDIIAKDGEWIVFCEVKYRETDNSGHALEAVGVYKQKVLSKCAAYYLMQKRKTDALCRFDVVGIQGEDITLIQNAFDYVEMF